MSLFQLLDELAAVDVAGRESVPCRRKAQGGGQMGLARAGRAKEQHILSVFQKTHGSQLINLALINGGLEGEIEVVQSFLDGEAGHLPARGTR